MLLESLALENPELYIFLASLIPTWEGRYSIPLALILRVDLIRAFLLASVATTILSLLLPQVLYKLDELFRAISRSNLRALGKLASAYLWYLESARRRVSGCVDRYGALGLAIFVAIPLPGTGVWTGSLASYALGMEKRKAVISLIAGGLLSNTIALIGSGLVAIKL